MILYYSNTSPYSRKARITLRVKGLQDNISEQLVLPLDNPAELHAANPLGKIPALVLDDGNSLFDSPLVCRYLNSLSAKSNVFPENDRQWSVLRGEALADGITDAAFNLAAEERRPTSEQSDLWKSRWEAAIGRALSEIEHRIEVLETDLSIAHIATVSALSYLELRMPDLLAQNKHAKTQTWLESFKQHIFVVETEYQT